jgi:hypothetical protein
VVPIIVKRTHWSMCHQITLVDCWSERRNVVLYLVCVWLGYHDFWCVLLLSIYKYKAIYFWLN